MPQNKIQTCVVAIWLKRMFPLLEPWLGRAFREKHNHGRLRGDMQRDLDEVWAKLPVVVRIRLEKAGLSTRKPESLATLLWRPQ